MNKLEVYKGVEIATGIVCYRKDDDYDLCNTRNQHRN
jgi:hypothetical protein